MRAAISTVCLLLVSISVAAQEGGTLAGRVLDASGRTLPGAAVEVVGTNLRTSADETGSFVISPVPAGERDVLVSFIGYEDQSFTVTVTARETTRQDFTLAAPTYTDTVTVNADPILRGQARALNQQKNALNIKSIISSDQIGRFPDPNAAEAAQRIPGVTLIRDQGEGRYISIRGTDPTLNSAMINGERTPAPEGATRQVALDVIPSDLLQAMELTKTLTPDMDGDAIGGALNLITAVAPTKERFSATLGGGYNELSGEPIVLGNLAWGRRFNDNLGLILTGSGFDTERVTQNYEPQYDDGELEELEPRDYTVTRERYGVTAGLDGNVGNATELRFTGVWNEFTDQEYRRAFTNAVADNELARELKDRYEAQSIYNLGLGGSTVFGGKSILEYRLTYAYAEEDEPNSWYSTFLQEDVEFAPNVSSDFIDRNDIQANPLNEDFEEYFLDEITNEGSLTKERDWIARVDLGFPFFSSDSLSGEWKVGLKGRFKEKSRETFVFAFEEDDVPFLDYVSNFQSSQPFFGGRYTIQPFQRISAATDIVRQFDLEGEEDLEENLADFDGTEDTLAGYGMAELLFGGKTTLMTGVRYEDTSTDYTAFEYLVDEEGDEFLRPVQGDNSYGIWLPNVQVRYALSTDSNVRAAITRSLARPNFEDQLPAQLFNREDFEIERGNPLLDPTNAWNLDLMYERFFRTVGLFSAGVFYKDLSDNIYFFNFEEERPDGTYEVTQPLNGDGAEVTGVELAYQNQFRNAPGFWSGFGVFANYTYTDSEANYPDRASTRLPGQAQNSANLAISYELGGFSGRLSWNLQGELILSPGGEAAEDEWLDDRTQLDLRIRQRFAQRWSVVLDLANLTNEPYRVYEGVFDRTIQEEIYDWWGTLSLRFDM